MIKGRLNIAIDGQWGSTGKGKLTGYLAEKTDVAVCDFAPNAGHTVIKDGNKHIFKMLPTCTINPDCYIMVNAGAAINVERLLEEIETHDVQDRLCIHPHAVIVTESDREYEREQLQRISSTLQGTGAAYGKKAMRHPDTKLAYDEPRLSEWIGDTTVKLHTFIKSGASCLAESAQGFDLSLNHGYTYPYITSRDITTASILNNAGVPPQLLGEVYASIRTYPIRVGHQYHPDGIKIGDSGPFYSDQSELSWDDMRRICGDQNLEDEKTTVTKKIRRIFTFSMKQFIKFVTVCMPTQIFLNFANYIDHDCYGARTWSELPKDVTDFVDDLNRSYIEIREKYSGLGVRNTGGVVTLIGTGPDNDHIVSLSL